MHPHLARQAIVRDVETTRYGRDYAGRRVKITHVQKDPHTGAAIGYVVRLEEGGNEVPFEPEEIQIFGGLGLRSATPLFTQLRRARTRRSFREHPFSGVR